MTLSLFDSTDPFQEAYGHTYAVLSELRERFHRSGRFDDSNTKLDEVSKIFATYLAFRTGQIPEFPHTESWSFVETLKSAFEKTAELPQYKLGDDFTIFGSNPSLAFRNDDEEMVVDMVKLVRQGIDFALDGRYTGRTFDILNEAFGHFIRDNFRSNIEDAQYMTPPEVTDFMAEIVLEDVKRDLRFRSAKHDSLTILDPSCGVGSFLSSIYRRSFGIDGLDPRRLRLFGQDKVERMVRLSTLNLELFDVEKYSITIGNSLELGSPLDRLNGTVDIILTNPPFGARFTQDYIAQRCGHNTPFFAGLKRSTTSLFSELLFIDRGISLLKDGGRMLIIVPDGVISSKGIAALLRQQLNRICNIVAIIELPSSTFAQAGTRTKTVILYLKKGRNENRFDNTFMAVANDLGFEVSSRKGVKIKMVNSKNELPAISDTYKVSLESEVSEGISVFSTQPSCVSVPESTIANGNWTPKHYEASRIETVFKLSRLSDFDMVPLRDLVYFHSGDRKAISWAEGYNFISVLHVIGDGFLNIGEIINYSPKTAGLPVSAGELLMSRINPRIPRVCVMPDLGSKTLCSSEFEIMTPKSDNDIYTLAYLLQTDVVLNQIRSLTSGTSASHNRIRTSELSEVLVPMVKRESRKWTLMKRLTEDYRLTLESLAHSTRALAKIRNEQQMIFGTTA